MLAASGTHPAQPQSSLWWRPGRQKGFFIHNLIASWGGVAGKIRSLVSCQGGGQRCDSAQRHRCGWGFVVSQGGAVAALTWCPCLSLLQACWPSSSRAWTSSSPWWAPSAAAPWLSSSRRCWRSPPTTPRACTPCSLPRTSPSASSASWASWWAPTRRWWSWWPPRPPW